MNKIERALLNIGMPANQLGFNYAADAVGLILCDPSYTTQITKRLYQDVATLHNTTGARTERAIRHSIETAWNRSDPQVLNKIFGYSVSPLKGKPTNSEFLATLALYLRDEKEDGNENN